MSFCGRCRRNGRSLDRDLLLIEGGREPMAGVESEVASQRNPSTVEPLPAHVRSIQPGNGWICRLEQAWGGLRRAYLRWFRRGYVERMAALRRGSADGAPHEILDPRDLKYVRNQCDCDWAEEHDPFRWRDRIPFARWGLAELVLLTSATAGMAVIGYVVAGWMLAVVPAAIGAVVVYFFRDPARTIPRGEAVVVAPADGRVVEVAEVDHDPFIEGPAIRIGIFLSVFNVHINRTSMSGRVIRLEYVPGKYLNALSPRSAKENENLSVYLEATEAPYRRHWIRQISGQIARRIVCDVRPGEAFGRGEKFGMIKLGSRTEVTIPKEAGLDIRVTIGSRLQAGQSVIATYGDTDHDD